MIRAEFSLTDEQVHQFTASRLRVWAALHCRDPGQAKEAVDGYDTAMDRMPATLAMRRGGVLYTVARDMAPEEVAALHELIASLRQSVPVVRSGFVEREREARTRTRAHFEQEALLEVLGLTASNVSSRGRVALLREVAFVGTETAFDALWTRPSATTSLARGDA